MVFVYLIALVLTSFFLIQSADHVVIAIRRLTHNATSQVFTLSAILLAMATSFPELSVAITASLEGTPVLSFGNVIGANIANISLVAGLSALIVGHVNVHGEFLKKDVAIALVAGLLPFILIIDGRLSRVDGLILLAAYGAYAASFFKYQRETFAHRFLHEVNHRQSIRSKEIVRLFVGLAVLLFSANLIVYFAKSLAALAGIPIFLVGLILLSIGTTLPELAFSIRSLKDREPTMFFGNILGSIIGNSTLILGLAALIHPIQIMALSKNIIAALAFIVIFITFWIFIRTKLVLSRLEAVLLLLLYAAFVVIEFL